MKQYQAPDCLLLTLAREDVLSLSMGDSSNNELQEYSLAYLFE